ncbi:MAG TPA: hypothetical protein VF959_08405 [Casimicrobiaceae bacterium]
MRIDDQLLRLSGKVWDCIEVPPYAEVATRAAPLAAAARKFVEEKFAKAALSGLEDPRICRLLPFWQQVFSDLGVGDGYVLVLSNPLNVARSLKHHDGFSTEKSCLLWLSHMRAAVAGIHGRRAVVVDYDNFLEDPRIQVERIAARLGLTIRLDVIDELPEHCARLVEPAPRRATIDEATMYAEGSVPDTAKDLFRALKLCARDLAALPSLADRTARTAISGAEYPWLARVVPFLEDELVRVRDRLAAMAEQIADARLLHAQRNEAEAVLREQAARMQRDLADERMTIASPTQEVDAARAALHDHENEVVAARTNIEALVVELEAARAAADFQQQQVEAARVQIELMGEDIAGACASAGARQQEVETAQRRIEDLVVEIETAARDATEHAERVAALRNDVICLNEQVDTTRNELRQSREVAATVAADRDQLVQLERSARERNALLDGQIATLKSEMAAVRARGAADAKELAVLARSWYGRLALRLVRRTQRQR